MTGDTPRITAITCVKDEGAFLIEWLAHHRGVGFTDFLIFSNDCSDGTEA
ncbi:MAG: glycosyltransferase family 2 protein, partial [Maritimibacter sp.]